MILPPEAAPLLALFAAEFTAPSAARFQTLFAAALLTTGRRTVAGVLRPLRHLAPGHATAYRRVLSRAEWSGLALGCALARYVVARLPAGEPVRLVGDDTVDGHTGRTVYGKARHRDPVRSSHAFTAWRYGHKWVVLAVLVVQQARVDGPDSYHTLRRSSKGSAVKKYRVTLTDDERQSLRDLIAAGKAAAAKLAHARVLLKADAAPGGPGWPDTQIAEAVEVSVRTVERVRERFVEQGLDAALVRQPQTRPSRMPKLDGSGEARLVALACSAPPDGRAAWTLSLLAGRLVELQVVESITGETVRKVLKKTSSSRG